MQLYRVFNEDLEPVPITWHGERSHAQTKGREYHPNLRAAVRIELVAIGNDKETMLKALNGELRSEDVSVIRTWALTDRGGLKEVPNGE